MKLIVLLSILLAGCADSYYERSVKEYNERQQAARAAMTEDERTYVDAKAHGCASGNSAGSIVGNTVKDVNKYIGNPFYKTGWDDGFAECKGQSEQLNAIIRKSL